MLNLMHNESFHEHEVGGPGDEGEGCDSMELVVIWERERDAIPNVLSVMSEGPGRAIWYL